MPTEITPTPDPRDEQIKQLQQDKDALMQDVINLEKENDALTQDLEDAKKAAKKGATPSGDYCVLKGKTYQVLGTVTTRFASEEGRKNNTEDQELVVIKH